MNPSRIAYFVSSATLNKPSLSMIARRCSVQGVVAGMTRERHSAMCQILPASIAIHYRPATGNEVRAESYGLLTTARHDGEGDWHQRGTFDDQRIFGPIRDFACPCGKYVGRDCDGYVCDRCGVKVTTTEVRRTRCAHINLPVGVRHPLESAGERLDAVPVLPVTFVAAPSGGELLRAYGQVLSARDEGEILPAFDALLHVLAPLLVIAHQWDLAQRLLIAHGMALKDRTESRAMSWTNRFAAE